MKYISILGLSAFLWSCSAKNNSDTPIIEVKTDLSELNYWGEYQINEQDFGTETKMKIEGGFRIMTTNAIPNHTTGIFPTKGNPNTISAQNKTYKFPISPKFSGESRWAREPGIALNGVKFEPETAERFVCETGEVYRIEAIQDLLNLGLDINNAHVQPTGAYHYHGVAQGLIEVLDNGGDVVLVGFAKDGFPMYYSKSGKYKPSFQLDTVTRTGDICSYTNPENDIHKDLSGSQPDGVFVSDWVYEEGLGELDECNGIEYNGSYAYFITDEYPYVSRCLKGQFNEEHPKGPPPGQHHPHGDNLHPPHGDQHPLKH